MLHISVVAGVLVLATAVVVWVLGQLSARDLQPVVRPRRLSHRRTVQLVTVVTALVSLVAAILALTVTGATRY